MASRIKTDKLMYLLFYDITSDSLRTKIAKRFVAQGYERLQYSVYTAIENPVKNVALWQELNLLLEKEPDAKLYVIPTSLNNFKMMKIIGKFDQDFDYLTGEKRSLIF